MISANLDDRDQMEARRKTSKDLAKTKLNLHLKELEKKAPYFKKLTNETLEEIKRAMAFLRIYGIRDFIEKPYTSHTAGVYDFVKGKLIPPKKNNDQNVSAALATAFMAEKGGLEERLQQDLAAMALLSDIDFERVTWRRAGSLAAGAGTTRKEGLIDVSRRDVDIQIHNFNQRLKPLDKTEKDGERWQVMGDGIVTEALKLYYFISGGIPLSPEDLKVKSETRILCPIYGFVKEYLRMVDGRKEPNEICSYLGKRYPHILQIFKDHVADERFNYIKLK